MQSYTLAPESCWGKAICGRAEVPELKLRESVKVNFKLQWRSQDPWNENQHVISTKESCAGDPGQERGHVCCSPHGSLLSSRHWTRSCSIWCLLCCISVFLSSNHFFTHPHLHFRTGMFILCHCMLEAHNCLVCSVQRLRVKKKNHRHHNSNTFKIWVFVSLFCFILCLYFACIYAYIPPTWLVPWRLEEGIKFMGIWVTDGYNVPCWC